MLPVSAGDGLNLAYRIALGLCIAPTSKRDIVHRGVVGRVGSRLARRSAIRDSLRALCLLIVHDGVAHLARGGV